MKNIHNIKDNALNIGACYKIGEVTNYENLVKLFFSPQGREFCTKHNFPTIEQFRQIKNKVKPYKVFVDAGEIEAYNQSHIAIIGNTHAKIKMHGVDELYHVIVMHGATATIEVEHYAVAHIVNISGGDVAIYNDKTTKVHYEHQSERSNR